jgi:hypothetical protein
MLINKGVKFNFVKSVKAEQLGEEIELCEILFNVTEHSIKQSANARIWQKI